MGWRLWQPLDLVTGVRMGNAVEQLRKGCEMESRELMLWQFDHEYVTEAAELMTVSFQNPMPSMEDVSQSLLAAETSIPAISDGFCQLLAVWADWNYGDCGWLRPRFP